jgi:hypothetical protein
MTYLGDYPRGETITHWVNFSGLTTGAPIEPSALTLVAYRGTSDTQFSTGISMTTLHDSVTGRMRVDVSTTSYALWIPGNNFGVMVGSVGTVDTVSVVGQTLFTFSIEKANDGRIAELSVSSYTTQVLTLPASTISYDEQLDGYDIKIFRASTAGELYRPTRIIVDSDSATQAITLDRPLPSNVSGTLTVRLYPGSLAATADEGGVEAARRVVRALIGQDGYTIDANTNTSRVSVTFPDGTSSAGTLTRAEVNPVTKVEGI